MIQVFTKNKLEKKTKEKIIEKLSGYLGHRVDISDIKFLTDSNIIGGLKIVIDSKVIDLTLNDRINKILDIIKS